MTPDDVCPDRVRGRCSGRDQKKGPRTFPWLESAWIKIVSPSNPNLKPPTPAFINAAFPVEGFSRYVARLDLIKHLESVGIADAGAAASVPVPVPVVTTKEGTEQGIAKGSG